MLSRTSVTKKNRLNTIIIMNEIKMFKVLWKLTLFCHKKLKLIFQLICDEMKNLFRKFRWRDLNFVTLVYESTMTQLAANSLDCRNDTSRIGLSINHKLNISVEMSSPWSVNSPKVELWVSWYRNREMFGQEMK